MLRTKASIGGTHTPRGEQRHEESGAHAGNASWGGAWILRYRCELFGEIDDALFTGIPNGFIRALN